MKVLYFTYFLVFCIWTTHGRDEKSSNEKSLAVIKPLKNGTFELHQKVRLVCEVENATSYVWYKDGKRISTRNRRVKTSGKKKPLSAKKRRPVRISRNRITIKRFEEKYAGVYECRGRDHRGHFGITRAIIKSQDPSCGPQFEEQSECVTFMAEKCRHITSYAPRPENLEVEIQIDDSDKAKYRVAILLEWNVPKQGRSSIWGWQIRIFGKENIAGYRRCYQLNKRYPKSGDVVERIAVHLPEAASTYEVEVQSLPNMGDPHNKTVARKDVKVPNWCILRPGFPACCESYINVSLGEGEHNRPALFWTTRYPSSLNVSIAGFILRWISEPNDRCNANAVVLGSQKSNYTFRNLTSSCGNYSIRIDVIFEDVERIGCRESPGTTILYVPPAPKQMVSNGPENKGNTLETVAFAMGASFCFGILILGFLMYWRRSKVKAKKNIFSCTPEPHDESVKVFILNPNHCNLCTDVIHALGSLLIKTGHIKCQIDMFVPFKQMCRGLMPWNEDMIKRSEYVIIPWMSEIRAPIPAKTANDINANIFTSSLEIISSELLKNPNDKVKFIPVYLDHCSIEILPSNQLLLHNYTIPSKVDDLVLELIGKTRRRPDPEQPFLQFDDKDYVTAKKNLENAITKLKRCHPGKRH